MVRGKGVHVSKKPKKSGINHQLWLILRKKIGFTTKFKLPKGKVSPGNDKHFLMGKFLGTTFKKKECVNFCRNRVQKSGSVCKCGAAEKDHEGFRSTLSEGMDWDPQDLEELLHLPKVGQSRQNDTKLNIQEIPTDAFGEIIFESKGNGNNLFPSRYLRLSDQTDSYRLSELFRAWKILGMKAKNQLVLNIIGTQHSPMSTDAREILRDGLGKAAKATSAIIVTDGLDQGIAKLIGTIIRDVQFVVKEEEGLIQGLPVIGVAPWGVLSQRAELINPVGSGFNCKRLPDRLDDSIELEAHHNHFFLVDDGYRERFSHGTIHQFRCKVLSTFQGIEIPIVSLLFEGGIEDLSSMMDLLKMGSKLVIFKGSGGLADILSYALDKSTQGRRSSREESKISEFHWSKVRAMIEYSFEEDFEKDNIEKIMDLVHDIITKSSAITVFDFAKNAKLDVTILTALFSQQKDKSQLLMLCLNWDRVDIAEKILSERSDSGKLQGTDELVEQCLLKQKSKFLNLLLESGVLIKPFLTVDRLRHLYNVVFSEWNELRLQLDYFLHDFDFNTQEISLFQIHKFLTKILRYHFSPNYELDTSLGKVVQAGLASHTKHRDWITEGTFQDPNMELFLWSVICNKQKLVDLFWRRSDQPILCASIAAILYKNLIIFYDKDQRQEGVERLQNHFVTLLNQMMKEAYEIDRFLTFALMEAKIERVKQMSFLHLIYYGDLRDVIANPQCQANAQINWKRGFSKLSIFRVILCFLCPILIFSPLVIFQAGLGSGGKSFGFFEKIYVFWKCPITKYCAWCISSLALAILHSYVALYSYRWEYLPSEIVLYIWLLILMITEIVEVLGGQATGLRNKIICHSVNIWNQFDFILLAFSLVNFILKNFQSTFWISRILFALTGIPIYLQLFRYYHASVKLGPKLVILVNMLPEVMVFMFLLLIFMLAYGVSSQALIDPYRPHEWSGFPSLLYHVLLLPYWQMYGELSLEQLAIKDVPSCGPNATFYDYCYRADVETVEDYGYVLPILLALYMLFANVLLLNLLIAVFSSVFDEVHSNSVGVWKWEMFRLMDDFDRRSTLAPPFNIVEMLFTGLKTIWRKCYQRKRDPTHLGQHDEHLVVFEKTCLAQFCDRLEKANTNSLEGKVALLDKKTDVVVGQLSAIRRLIDPEGVPHYEGENQTHRVQRVLRLSAAEEAPHQGESVNGDLKALNQRVKMMERTLHSILRQLERMK